MNDYTACEYPLSQIYFYITNACNLSCRHCWLAEESSHSSFISHKFFETVIREAKPLGLSAVKITGGEPLLHPQFSDMLAIVRHEGINLSIETNGWFCTPEIAEDIAQCPGVSVSVSIDGVSAEVHDYIRGVPGAFKRACEAVSNLVICGVHTQIIMSIMRKNADHVIPMVDMAQKLGASSLKFNIVQPISRGAALQQDNETLSISEIIRLGNRVNLTIAQKSSIPLIFDYPMAFRPLSRMFSEDCHTCGIIGIIGVIESGHYALCGIGKHVPELIFGTVGKDSLESVWNKNPVLKSLRQNLPSRLEGICGKCLMKSRCLGSCVALNFYRTGNLFSPFWLCEKAEAEGLFPDSRRI